MRKPRRRALCALGLAAPAFLFVTTGDMARAQDPTITTTVDAAEADGDTTPPPPHVKWNQKEWKRFSFRLSFNFIYDYSAYSQTEDSKAQMTLRPKDDVRDFRVIVKGKLFIPRLSYSIGCMYDGAKDDWRFRQTGIMVDVPEAHGSVFLGRSKEGFSTSKIMNGTHTWTNERASINDALLPILADGIKWMGYVPSGKFVYNLGFFKDTRSQYESFNKNDNQSIIRGVWLPFAGIDKGVLHLALQARHGAANDGSLQYRAKPESSEAQVFAIDTGKFAADHSNTYGVETYYRPGPLMFGMEYFFNQVSAPESGDPFFHGGEIFAAYLLTGETRPYNARGAYFERIPPARSVFSGGPGAWEVVLRYSYADLADGPIQGGTFWRITPMVNWHLSDYMRLEFVYGYGMLDRFGVQGATQFFQTRLQLQL